MSCIIGLMTAKLMIVRDTASKAPKAYKGNDFVTDVRIDYRQNRGIS